MHLLKHNQSLAKHSTFGIGGRARFFVEVTTVDELQEVLAYCRAQNLPFHVLGKGSNSLFDDRGFGGLVIHVKISYLQIDATRVVVGGGYSFALLGVKTALKGLAGLEFASGIPGSVGGAVFMNAGANGAEVADVLTRILFIDHLGKLQCFDRDDLIFSYRYSSFHQMKGVIVEATFACHVDPKARQRQLEIVNYRIQTQPYEELSCGCVFRNPEGARAGALIDQCGLKGARIGGAVVSSTHANFIVNRQGAKASDVVLLAEHVKACVKEQTQVELEMELRTVPYRE